MLKHNFFRAVQRLAVWFSELERPLMATIIKRSLVQTPQWSTCCVPQKRLFFLLWLDWEQAGNLSVNAAQLKRNVELGNTPKQVWATAPRLKLLTLCCEPGGMTMFHIEYLPTCRRSKTFFRQLRTWRFRPYVGLDWHSKATLRCASEIINDDNWSNLSHTIWKWEFGSLTWQSRNVTVFAVGSHKQISHESCSLCFKSELDSKQSVTQTRNAICNEILWELNSQTSDYMQSIS